MSRYLFHHRYLIARRWVQLLLLFLFAGSNYFGWKVLMGNYSSALVFQKFYLADPHAVLQTFLSGFAISVDLLVGAVIVLVLYAGISGRAFCSWVCPMNLATDFAAWIRQKTAMTDLPGIKNLITRKTRYWILVLGLVLSVIFGIAAFELINPISMLYRGVVFGFGAGIAAVILIFFFDLFVLKNGWCGYICPLGAFYSLVSRYSILKVNHKVEACTKCMKCIQICPESQVLEIIGIHSGKIVSGECTNCGRCIEVCEDNALKYVLIK